MSDASNSIIAIPEGYIWAECPASRSGWVECPDHYGPDEITEADIAHDCAIRALTDDEAEAMQAPR